jgi:hypothetical protein
LLVVVNMRAKPAIEDPLPAFLEIEATKIPEVAKVVEVASVVEVPKVAKPETPAPVERKAGSGIPGMPGVGGGRKQLAAPSTEMLRRPAKKEQNDSDQYDDSHDSPPPLVSVAAKASEEEDAPSEDPDEYPAATPMFKIVDITNRTKFQETVTALQKNLGTETRYKQFFATCTEIDWENEEGTDELLRQVVEWYDFWPTFTRFRESLDPG